MNKQCKTALWMDVMNSKKRPYSTAECKQILKWHNLWRRGKPMKMLPPAIIGLAIDKVCDE